MKVLALSSYGVLAGAELSMMKFIEHRPAGVEVVAVLVEDGALREHLSSAGIRTWAARGYDGRPGLHGVARFTRELLPLLRRNLHDAYAAGVRIAFGTDTFGLSSHGENAQEFALLVAAGMTPMDAIKTATGNAADLLGSADVGTLQAGRYADVIAVDGDPLSDVKVLEHVGFVMKGGAIVKSAGQPQI